VLLGFWLVRPYVNHPRGKPIMHIAAIQLAHHVALDPRRRYYEEAMRWHAWYLGPFALAAGVLGAGLFARETLRRGTIAHWALTVAFGIVTAIYLWNASITPDQIWAMRRFVPIVIPGFLLFAVVALDWLVRRAGRAGIAVGVLLAVAFVAWPLSATLPVRDEVTQAGMLDAVDATCRALGPDAAVVMMNGPTELYRQAPQTLRGFCDVPVAVQTDDFDNARFAELAREWRAAGRVLYVVADSPERITGSLPRAEPNVVGVAINDDLLDQTVVGPPRHYVHARSEFVIAKVPLG
jgi:hypothetical protein